MLRTGYRTPLNSRGSLTASGFEGDFPRSVTEEYLDEEDDPDVLRAIALLLKIESNTTNTPLHTADEHMLHSVMVPLRHTSLSEQTPGAVMLDLFTRTQRMSTPATHTHTHTPSFLPVI